MTLGELFEETYIQGEIAIRSYDSTGTTIEHYLGDAEEFYPDEHPQILEREVGYIFPLMEVEPTICIELKNEEDEQLEAAREELASTRAQLAECRSQVEGFAARFERIKAELAQIAECLSVRGFLGSFKAKLAEFATS